MHLLGRIKRLLRSVPPLTYAVTRDVETPYLSLVVYILGILFVVFITIVAVITSAYEYTPVLSSSFNQTQAIWYDFLDTKWLPAPRTCQGSLMKVGEGINHRTV